MGNHADHGTAPRGDTARARDCGTCYGWGTVVTPQGRHELCPACQQPESPAGDRPVNGAASNTPRPRQPVAGPPRPGRGAPHQVTRLPSAPGARRQPGGAVRCCGGA